MAEVNIFAIPHSAALDNIVALDIIRNKYDAYFLELNPDFARTENDLAKRGVKLGLVYNDDTTKENIPSFFKTSYCNAKKKGLDVIFIDDDKKVAEQLELNRKSESTAFSLLTHKVLMKYGVEKNDMNAIRKEVDALLVFYKKSYDCARERSTLMAKRIDEEIVKNNYAYSVVQMGIAHLDAIEPLKERYDVKYETLFDEKIADYSCWKIAMKHTDIVCDDMDTGEKDLCLTEIETLNLVNMRNNDLKAFNKYAMRQITFDQLADVICDSYLFKEI